MEYLVEVSEGKKLNMGQGDQRWTDNLYIFGLKKMWWVRKSWTRLIKLGVILVACSEFCKRDKLAGVLRGDAQKLWWTYFV